MPATYPCPSKIVLVLDDSESVVGLMLTDRSLSKRDGRTLVKSLRSLPQYAATPILLLAAEH